MKAHLLFTGFLGTYVINRVHNGVDVNVSDIGVVGAIHRYQIVHHIFGFIRRKWLLHQRRVGDERFHLGIACHAVGQC